MADLHLPAELIERLDALAREEQRTVESLIESWLQEYTDRKVGQDLADTPEKREAQLLTDRMRFYQAARRYWYSVGDSRQAMSDKELDDDFWLIDQEGVPHLRSDLTTPDIPENPLQSILDAIALDRQLWSFGDSAHHVSERSREILQNEFADYLMARMKRPAASQDK